MSVNEHRFRAMGTNVHVVVVGGDDAVLAEVEAMVCRLEARWSRFVPTSELCRINDAGGYPVVVPEDTFSLLALAVAAWYRTHGLFDPTVLHALEAAGYTTSFDVLPTELHRLVPATPTPGCGRVVLDPVLSSVQLPTDIALDLGGIGKGFTADLIGARLMARGCDGILINLGGDLWCSGTAPSADGWIVGIEDPMQVDSGVEALRLALGGGAVATSTRLRRRWSLDGRSAHHLIDPRSGSPAESDVVSATVVAGSAAWAEVLAKSVLIGGVQSGAELLAANDATGVAMLADGRRHRFAGLEAYEDSSTDHLV